MFNEDYLKLMADLFSNPLFKRGFLEYFVKMQQEGIEAARRFWSPVRDLPSASPEIFEKIIDFYLILGFVPSYKFEEVAAERDRLREENRFLKETLKELQSAIFTSGSKGFQESWHAIVDRQFELNREIAKNFFELFRTLKAEPPGQERPAGDRRTRKGGSREGGYGEGEADEKKPDGQAKSQA
jgi:hypothetical protein